MRRSRRIRRRFRSRERRADGPCIFQSSFDGAKFSRRNHSRLRLNLNLAPPPPRYLLTCVFSRLLSIPLSSLFFSETLSRSLPFLDDVARTDVDAVTRGMVVEIVPVLWHEPCSFGLFVSRLCNSRRLNHRLETPSSFVPAARILIYAIPLSSAARASSALFSYRLVLSDSEGES